MGAYGIKSLACQSGSTYAGIADRYGAAAARPAAMQLEYPAML